MALTLTEKKQIVAGCGDLIEKTYRALVARIEALEAELREAQRTALADRYRGVHVRGANYQRGELVTASGSLFLCLKSTEAAPAESPDWKMVAKRGRNGKSE
jgi:multidrug efflux pump subunit AcrA (membrane-fusion protein)